MSHHGFFMRLCLTLLFCISTAAVTFAEGEDDGWIPLFNGKDLTGWYTYLDQDGRNNDPGQVFTIEDGVIHVYKHAEDGAQVPIGFIATETEYSHYHLRFQYKWGSKRFGPRAQDKRDSGVMYHCVGPDGVLMKTWPRCLECQVQEHDTGDLLCIAGTRCRTTIDPDPAEILPRVYQGKYLPAQEGGQQITNDRWIRRSHERDELKQWNTVDLIVAGSDYAVHVVNGRANNRLTELRQRGSQEGQWVSLAGGRIVLQAELAEVFFRNIKIKPLATGPFRQSGVPLVAAADGSFELHAYDASLAGPSLRYQPDEHGTLGHWHTPQDKATWTIDVSQAGRYDFELNWSIDDRAAVNTFQVLASGSSFQAKVPGTGGWWTYKRRVFGQLDMEAGVQDITVQPVGEFRGALMDIRDVRLIRVE